MIDLTQFEGHTKGPFKVTRLSHVNDKLWLQVSRADGWGPIARTACKAEPMPGAIAEMKYLVTDEKEQWANAILFAAAPDLVSELAATRERVKRLEKALKPFAVIGDVFLKQSDGNNSPWTRVPDERKAALQHLLPTVGDLRKAAELLQGDKQ